MVSISATGSTSSHPPTACPQLTDRIAAALLARARNGLLRELRLPDPSSADFASNDYLGLARTNSAFKSFLSSWIRSDFVLSSGSTGSRLLTGHSSAICSLESEAAVFHGVQSALLLSSGYAANLAALSTLPGPDDAIVHDALIHASMHDGLRLSRCRDALFPFAHNDIAALQHSIKAAATQVHGSILVVVETVYSMDGDIAPIADILTTAEFEERRLGRQVRVVVDEAHGIGLFGSHGEGLLRALCLQEHANLLATIVTFGKAFAAHGAMVLSNKTVREYLINYARPLIYSTAPPPHTVEVLRAAYAFSRTTAAAEARNRLWKMVKLFEMQVKTKLPADTLLASTGRSAIQAVLVVGNYHVARAAAQLRDVGLDVYPIRSPTVARGAERIRIVLHAHNTEAEVVRLVEALQKVLSQQKEAKARL